MSAQHWTISATQAKHIYGYIYKAFSWRVNPQQIKSGTADSNLGFYDFSIFSQN